MNSGDTVVIPLSPSAPPTIFITHAEGETFWINPDVWPGDSFMETFEDLSNCYIDEKAEFFDRNIAL